MYKRQSLDELIEFDLDIQEIQETIDRTNGKAEANVDWTKAWGKKYPVLLSYQEKVDIPFYARRLKELLDELQQESQFSRQDATLVLKDIPVSYTHLDVYKRQFRFRSGHSGECGARYDEKP